MLGSKTITFGPKAGVAAVAPPPSVSAKATATEPHRFLAMRKLLTSTLGTRRRGGPGCGPSYAGAVGAAGITAAAGRRRGRASTPAQAPPAPGEHRRRDVLGAALVLPPYTQRVPHPRPK